MNVQYIADKTGHTTAVQLQIPIEDWDLLKKKYKEFNTRGGIIKEIWLILGCLKFFMISFFFV